MVAKVVDKPNRDLIGAGKGFTGNLRSKNLEKPPTNWSPEGIYENTDEKAEHGPAGSTSKDLAQLTGKEALRTPRFYLLWIVMFPNIAAGLMVLSQASNMTQEITGASAAIAATVVGTIGVFNAGGRIVWSSFSDYTNRTNMFTFFYRQIVLFLIMTSVTNVYLFAIMLFLIVSFMGGGFACLPAYIGDLFGTKEVAVIHGYLLTPWAMAGLLSPQMIVYIRDMMGSFEQGMYIIAVAMIVGLAAITMLRIQIGRVENRRSTSVVSSDISD